MENISSQHIDGFLLVISCAVYPLTPQNHHAASPVDTGVSGRPAGRGRVGQEHRGVQRHLIPAQRHPRQCEWLSLRTADECMMVSVALFIAQLLTQNVDS